MAMPNCLRLFWQLIRAAASRTFCTAGRRRPIRMAMIAITTNSSISVKASRAGALTFRIDAPVRNEERRKPRAPGRRAAERLLRVHLDGELVIPRPHLQA